MDEGGSTPLDTVLKGLRKGSARVAERVVGDPQPVHTWPRNVGTRRALTPREPSQIPYKYLPMWRSSLPKRDCAGCPRGANSAPHTV